MSAPTEQEIREALPELWETAFPVGTVPAIEWGEAWSDALLFGRGLYDETDFRRSETARLDELIEDAVDVVRKKALGELFEAVTGALLQFAAEYPDAPRPKVPTA